METGLPTDGRMGGHTPVFLKAVEHYGQHGRNKKLPKDVEAALVGDHPTTHYIWRTAGDKNVRPEHAENDGRIFSWNKPPRTGHPGAEYGCRCWAEAYPSRVGDIHEQEYAKHSIIYYPNDRVIPWDTPLYVAYFYFGGGKPLTLHETGNLKAVIEACEKNHVFNRFSLEIIEEARLRKSGQFEHDFHSAYNFFGDVRFAFGGGTVSGNFTGNTEVVGDYLKINGTIDYRYYDVFTDPRGERQKQIGTSDPAKASPELLRQTEYGGTYYQIVDAWKATLDALVSKEAKHNMIINTNFTGDASPT
jgi:hypothetical protein